MRHALALVLIAACANLTGNTNRECSDIHPQKTVRRPEWRGTIFTIVMENKSRGQIFGNQDDAPFLNALAHRYAVAGGYVDNLIHPSEPNYIWMIAGENFGILDDDNPASHHIGTKSHVIDQLELQGLSWKAYMESMGEPCGTASNYPYEPKHDPFVYFDDIRDTKRCREHVVDFKAFAHDLETNAMADYVFITPNMQHDMHDGSIHTGDQWLARVVGKILGSEAYKKGGVIFVTWDEGYEGADDPPMIVVSPHAKRGYVSNTPYNASSYLKTIEKILGVEPLPCDPAPDKVMTMDELFDVPLEAVPSS